MSHVIALHCCSICTVGLAAGSLQSLCPELRLLDACLDQTWLLTFCQTLEIPRKQALGVILHAERCLQLIGKTAIGQGFRYEYTWHTITCLSLH